MKMTKRPGIIVFSKDGDASFQYMSDGWGHERVRDTPESKRLKALAGEEIDQAKSVPDAIMRLEAVGFKIIRDPNYTAILGGNHETG